MNAVGEAEDEVNSKKEKQPASEEVVKDKPKPKKTRFIWTRKVHNRFLEVVEQLGPKKAVPTKILQLMNVEGLTRENVASHLQKFRLQKKRRCQEEAQAQAQALAASGNVPKGDMSGITPQQPCVQPNMTQGINIERALLEQSQLAPSFTNHNLNLIREFPTVQEVYGAPFKGLFDEGVNRLSNGLLDTNNIGYNFGPLPPKPLFHAHAHSSMDRSYFHDTTLVPQYDRHHQLSLADQGIITPSFVSQYDRRHELSLTDRSIISPSFVPQYNRRHESSLSDQGIINPSFVSLYDQSIASPAFVPQYNQRLESSLVDQDIISPSLVPLHDRSQELSVADLEIVSYSVVPQYDQHNETSLINHGIISPSFGPRHDEFSVAEQGIISPSSAQEGLGAGLPHLPVPVPVPVPVPITTGGQPEGTGGGMPHLLETTEGHGVPLILKETGGHSGMMTEATIVFTGMEVEGPGLDMSFLDEATEILAGMNDFQQGCFRFSEEKESANDWRGFLRDL